MCVCFSEYKELGLARGMEITVLMLRAGESMVSPTAEFQATDT